MTDRPSPGVHLARMALWGLVYAFIISHLHIEWILTDTPPTGGDMASHYPAFLFLKDRLMETGRISGWDWGNYAGFPPFLMYFPLPFLAMAALSLVVPAAIAYKLGAVTGVLALPLAAHGLFRRMGFPRPAPDLAALFVLPFLFQESHQAWGGNLASVLAGEVTYSWGLALTLVYLGLSYRDAGTGRGMLVRSLLLAMVGLSHGYTLLFCVLGQGALLVTTRRWTARLADLLTVNLWAFGWMGFWIVPLLMHSPDTTPFNFVWTIDGVRTVFPSLLWPFLALTAVQAALACRPCVGDERRRRLLFFGFQILAALVFFLIAFKIGVVDVRFLPPGLLFLILPAAAFLGEWCSRRAAPRLLAMAAVFLVIPWTAAHVQYVDAWASWNFSGWETKPLGPALNRVTRHLDGDFGLPRVMYEHHPAAAGAGTVRTFENLPWFSGRATLEGAYIQASLSAPAVFYLQSELSPQMSAPLTQINYSRFDPARALAHLRLFNVGQLITVSDEARRAVRNSPGYVLEMTADPFAVFRVEGGRERYGIQPRFRPMAVTTGRPKEASFQWFRAGDPDLPLVVTERVDPGDRDRFADVFDETRLQEKIREPTRRPLDAEPILSETLGRNEIVITGASPGRPLWIRVSYHPNWRVEGADRIWRTAPSFMLVFPTRSTVRLAYGRSFPEYLGLVLTGLAIAAAGVTLIFRKRDAGRRFSPFVLIQKGLRRPAMVLAPRAGWALAGGCLGAGLAALYLIFLVSFEEPGVYFRRGLDYFNAGDLARAREVWLEGVEKFPYSPSVDGSLYHVGLSWLKEKNGPAAREAWQTLIGRYPESRVLPEAWYHVGRTYQMEDRWEDARAAYLEVAHRFPDTDWAQWAGRAMGETLDAQWDQELASAAGDDRNGQWAEAAQEAARLRDQAPDSGRALQAARLAAQALVRLGRWREAEKAWDAFREADLEGDFEAEALYGLGEARRGAGDREGAAGFWRRAAEVQPPTAWSEKARDALNTLEGSPEP